MPPWHHWLQTASGNCFPACDDNAKAASVSTSKKMLQMGVQRVTQKAIS